MEKTNGENLYKRPLARKQTMEKIDGETRADRNPVPGVCEDVAHSREYCKKRPRLYF